MDVKREGVAKRKAIRLWIMIGLGVLCVPLITYGLSRLNPPRLQSKVARFGRAPSNAA